MTIPLSMRARNLYYCIVRHFPLRLLWCDLDLSTVPRGTFFAHPYGVTLQVSTKWGRGCVIRQNVTVGYRWRFDGSEPGAVIGDEVRLEAGCTVLGPVHIGDRAIIGAGAVVLQDVPGYMSAVGNPARIVGRKCARKFLEVFRRVPVRASADVPLRCVAEENPARAIRRVS